MTIDHVAIMYQACTADKECGKCYQCEVANEYHELGGSIKQLWCHQYDLETRRGMRCGLFIVKQPKAKGETKNEPELFE